MVLGKHFTTLTFPSSPSPLIVSKDAMDFKAGPTSARLAIGILENCKKESKAQAKWNLGMPGLCQHLYSSKGVIKTSHTLQSLIFRRRNYPKYPNQMGKQIV